MEFSETNKNNLSKGMLTHTQKRQSKDPFEALCQEQQSNCRCHVLGNREPLQAVEQDKCN
jgi:hypothetical protein